MSSGSCTLPSTPGADDKVMDKLELGPTGPIDIDIPGLPNTWTRSTFDDSESVSNIGQRRSNVFLRFRWAGSVDFLALSVGTNTVIHVADIASGNLSPSSSVACYS